MKDDIRNLIIVAGFVLIVGVGLGILLGLAIIALGWA